MDSQKCYIVAYKYESFSFVFDESGGMKSLLQEKQCLALQEKK